MTSTPDTAPGSPVSSPPPAISVLGAVEGLEVARRASRPSSSRSRSRSCCRRRQRLFTGINRTAASPVTRFGLPEDRVVALGSNIDL